MKSHNTTQFLSQPDSDMLSSAIKLHRSGNLNDAEIIYKHLITLNSHNYNALSLLGTIYAQRGDYIEAIQSMNAAIAVNPTHAETYYNRGLVQQLLGQYEKSLTDYVKATESDPNYAEAYWHRSLNLLTLGRYIEGWKLYEWRWKRVGQGQLMPYQKPLDLDKEKLVNKTIALYAEQGFGDTLQFCRYIHLLAKDNKIIFECPASLGALMRHNFPNVRILEASNEHDKAEKISDCDYHINLMSLPMVFGTTLENIPFGIPTKEYKSTCDYSSYVYLQADHEYIKKWKKLLQNITAESSKPQIIGLCWAGGQRPNNLDAMSVDARRSIRFEQMKPILDIQNTKFISLQLGSPANQIDDNRVIDFSSEIRNWSDTAALVSLLDIVISVDTSVCHLAAAMGKKTLLLNRYDTCWRWLLKRKDSPWYPSLTQYRQTAPGNWSEAIEKVKNFLQDSTLSVDQR